MALAHYLAVMPRFSKFRGLGLNTIRHDGISNSPMVNRAQYWIIGNEIGNLSLVGYANSLGMTSIMLWLKRLFGPSAFFSPSASPLSRHTYSQLLGRIVWIFHSLSFIVNIIRVIVICKCLFFDLISICYGINGHVTACFQRNE